MMKRLCDLKIRNEIKISLYLSFAMAFMLLIFAPLELYFTNVTEWWYDIYFLLPVMGLLFCVALILSMFLLLVVDYFSNRIYRGVVVFYLIAYVCLYVQGNFLASTLPLMDGRIINWEEYSAERWKNFFLIIIVSIGMVTIFKSVSYEKFEMILKTTCLFITGVLTVTIVVLSLTVNGWQEKRILRRLHIIY